MSGSGDKAMLRDVIVFRDLRPGEISEIEDVASEVIYSRNQVIFEEGDPGDALYVIKSGEVRIIRVTPAGIEKVLARLGPRSFFGEMSLLDGYPRSASAVADSRCELFRIAKSDLDGLIGKNSIAAYKVIYGFARTLSYRLRKMNDKLIEIFSDPDKTINEILEELGEDRDILLSGWSNFPE